MTDKKSSDSRRKLLKSIAAGSGAIVAGKSLPESWSKPVVDSVMLPAHALTSPRQFTSRGQTIMSAAPSSDSIFSSVTNTLLPEAQADCTYTAEACITDNGDGTVKVDATIEDCSCNAAQFSANATVAGDPVVMNIDRDCSKDVGLMDQLGLKRHWSIYYCRSDTRV
jgi:hypothetical protein